MTKENDYAFAKDRKICSLNTILAFGKHSQATISRVIQADVKYIDWLLSEKIIELDADAYRLYQKTFNEQ